MDTGGMSMDMIREDPEMYMSPDMMALFDDGGVNVAHLFSSQFMPAQGHQPQHQGGSGLNAGGEAYGNAAFVKHSNGLVTSP